MHESELLDEAIQEAQKRTSAFAHLTHLGGHWTPSERRIFELGALLGATEMYKLDVQDWIVNG